MHNACERKTAHRRCGRLGRRVFCRLDNARFSSCWRRACPVRRSRPGSAYRRVRSSRIANHSMRDFVRGVDPRPSRTRGACLCYLEVGDRASMQRSALIIGASRGLGWGLACELVRQGWRVVGTVRDTKRHTRLHELKAETRHAVEIEQVDIASQADIASLRARLAGERFDLLFVVAGVTNDIRETISRVTTG